MGEYARDLWAKQYERRSVVTEHRTPYEPSESLIEAGMDAVPMIGALSAGSREAVRNTVRRVLIAAHEYEMRHSLGQL